VASAAAGVAEAQKLLHNGDWEQALAVLTQARRDEPGNADVDYMMATIYLERHRVAEGIAAAQTAIHKNPSLKTDGDLINAAIGGLASDKAYDRAEAFLRGLGAAAVPFLREAAHHHPVAKVRERAAELLQGVGSGGGFSRSASASPSRSSGSGMFSR
jgi:thioredoxin-like negative regulator of GroEL